MPHASSSTNSERDERVFIAAFGMMDSHQDGEATAAFMRVREILRRHGGGFRRMLERSHDAERLNQELGKQNAQLLRENTALRARDSRPLSPSPTSTPKPFVIPAMPGLPHWDIGFIGIIALSTAYGLLGATTALALTAAILVCAAFTNGFSPIRFLVGILLGLAALGTGVSNRTESVAAPTPAIADAPASTAPTTAAYAAADAASQARSLANTPALTAAPAADAAPQRQTLAYAPSPRPHSFADLPPRRTSVEPRTRHGTAAKSHCDPSRLEPGFTCPRSTPWRRNFFPDFGRSLSMRYD